MSRQEPAFLLQAEELTVTVTRKNVKNLSLRVLPPDGRICATVPRGVPDGELRRFVLSRLPWLRAHGALVLQRAAAAVRRLEEGAPWPVWGRLYPLALREGPEDRVLLQAGRLVLQTRPGADEAARAALLKGWYRAQLMQAVPPALARCQARTGLRAAEWRIRDMRTRWGTCNIRDARIWLALRLAEKPPECLEYVLVHELTHLLERGHNTRFRALMDRFAPDWRTVKARLDGEPLPLSSL